MQYYGDAVAKKYTTKCVLSLLCATSDAHPALPFVARLLSTRVQRIQAEMTTRALELLNLPPDGPPALLLDIGCGSGLSGEILDELGHVWVGMDVAPSMLGMYVVFARADGLTPARNRAGT